MYPTWLEWGGDFFCHQKLYIWGRLRSLHFCPSSPHDINYVFFSLAWGYFSHTYLPDILYHEEGGKGAWYSRPLYYALIFGNFIFELHKCILYRLRLLKHFLCRIPSPGQETVLSYLPLSHISTQVASLILSYPPLSHISTQVASLILSYPPLSHLST